MMDALDRAIAATQAHLESLRHANGHWEGHLSSSALSTATAIVALSLVDREKHAAFIQKGAQWLCDHQNADGGWGDTTLSKSNLSTTLLCWSALHRCGRPHPPSHPPTPGSPPRLALLSPRPSPRPSYRATARTRPSPCPFSCSAPCAAPWGTSHGSTSLRCPSSSRLFRALGLVPSACPWSATLLPALIAIGYTRFKNAPPAWWNPLRWIRALAWPRIRPMLQTLQPSSGGYLEATPLTSFVTMALAGAGQLDHPCLPLAVEFLRHSMREDGSWPIDTNLSTWGTTLAMRAQEGSAGTPARAVPPPTGSSPSNTARPTPSPTPRPAAGPGPTSPAVSPMPTTPAALSSTLKQSIGEAQRLADAAIEHPHRSRHRLAP
jgi:squalene-hopene/tetraprenyl-beta-curcumene cyclase